MWFLGCLHKRSADVSLPLTVLDTFRPREVLKRATPPPGHNGCPHLCGDDEAGAHRAPPVRKHICGEGRATLHSRCPQIPPGVYLRLSQSLSGRALPLTPAQHHSPQTADAWSSAVESILVNVCRSRSPQFAGVCELCDDGPACTRISSLAGRSAINRTARLLQDDCRCPPRALQAVCGTRRTKFRRPPTRRAGAPHSSYALATPGA